MGDSQAARTEPSAGAENAPNPQSSQLTRDDLAPRLTVESLAPGGADDADDFDYFPHMNPNNAATPEDKAAVEALKAGTYMPLMTPVEYTGGWDSNFATFGATLKQGMHTISGGQESQISYDGDEATVSAMRLHGQIKRKLWVDQHIGQVPPFEMYQAIAAVSPRGLVGSESQRLKDLARMYLQNRVPIRRKYYANPRQYYDHILLADAYANTFAGEVIDTVVDFVMGGGIYPAIVLRNPTGDPETDREALEEGRQAARILIGIDQWYSDMGPEKQDPYFDVPLEDKLRDAITSMLVFGRACIAKERWGHLPKVEIIEPEEPPARPKNGDGGDEDGDGGAFPGGKNGNSGKKSDVGAAVEDDSGSGTDDSGDIGGGGKNGKEDYKKKEGGNVLKFPDMPNVLKIIHPIEMGLTEVELYTGKVAGVWISNDQPYLPADEMVYLVNSFSSPMIGTNTYGFTRLQRCIDQTRLYRRLIAKNFPQFLRTSASGMGAFIMNTTGYPQAVRERIRQSMRNLYRTGEIAVIDYANVADFEWKEFKINTDIDALVTLEQAMLSTISTVMGVPHSIVFDSAESRATLIGRIVTYMSTTIKSTRRRLGLQLAQQWWLPNLRLVKKDDPEFLKKYTVEVRYVELSLETKLEKVERLLQETQLNPYKNAYLGEQLDDPEYESHIDEEKIEEQNEKDDRMMDAEIAKMENGGPGGPPDGSGSKNVQDGARRSNSKNGTPIGTKGDTAKRKSSSTSG